MVGRPPTKSMEILSHGLIGTFKGWYRPLFLLMGFIVEQSMDPLINQATSSYILGW